MNRVERCRPTTLKAGQKLRYHGRVNTLELVFVRRRRKTGLCEFLKDGKPYVLLDIEVRLGCERV